MDHLARGSMKNAANCVSECELQDIRASTLWTHIAERGSSTLHVWFRDGLTSIQPCCWHWAFPSSPRDGFKFLRARDPCLWSLTLGSISWLPGLALGLYGGSCFLAVFVSNPPCQTYSRPESRQDYPPNLSILISGGKENNRDALSNGEWNGRSPAANRRPFLSRGMCCSAEPHRGSTTGPSTPWLGP